MKRIVFLIGTLLLISTMVVFGGGAQEDPGAAVEENAIRIGAIISLTGDEAEQSIEYKRANDLLLPQLNAKGGIHGYPISLISVDGQSKPEVHASKAHRLLETENVVAGYGGSDISTATAAGKIFQDAETAFIDILGTTPTIPLVGDYMFMAPGPDNNQGRAIAHYMYYELGYDTVTIFKDVASSYGTKLTEYIIHFFKEVTGKEDPVPFIPAYNTGDDDYTAQLTRLKPKIEELGIQAIVLPTWPEDGPKIAKQARELGIETPFIGCDGVDTEVLTKIGGDSVEGMLFSALFSMNQPNLSDEIIAFSKEYKEKYGEEMGSAGAMAYDCLVIIKTAISSVIDEKGKSWWDTADLADKRIAIRDMIAKSTFTETTQPLSFTAEGAPTRGVVWKLVKNGERTYYDFQDYDDFTPPGTEVLPFR